MSPCCDLDQSGMWSTSCGYVATLSSTHTHRPLSQHVGLGPQGHKQTVTRCRRALSKLYDKHCSPSCHRHHRLICCFRALLPLCRHLECFKWLRYVHLALTLAQAWVVLFVDSKEKQDTSSCAGSSPECCVASWRSSIKSSHCTVCIVNVCKCCSKGGKAWLFFMEIKPN